MMQTLSGQLKRLPPSLQTEWCFEDGTYKYLSQKGISFIGAPHPGSQEVFGAQNSARALRDAHVATAAKRLGWSFRDLGDVTLKESIGRRFGGGFPGIHEYSDSSRVANRLLVDTVRTEATRGNFVLTVGGEESSAATIEGMRAVHKDLAVLVIDCFRPLSARCIETEVQSAFDGQHRSSTSQARSVAYVGISDITEDERDRLHQQGIVVYTMREVEEWGVGRIIDMALQRINPRLSRPTHLSFNFDSVERTKAEMEGPSHGVNRLSFVESQIICTKLAKSSSLCSMALLEAAEGLEVPMKLKVVDDNVRLGIELIRSALGHSEE